MSKQIQPIEFLWLGLYTFAGFSLELFLGFFVNVLGYDHLNKTFNLLLTGGLWFAFSFLLIYYTKQKFNYSLQNNRQPFFLSGFFIAFLCIISIIIVTYLGFQGFKPIVEFNNGSNGDIITYLSQVFYYLGESLLITLGIIFGQQFFENQFKINKNIPSGGIFLALTWGIMHFFLQGFNSGLYALLFSIFAGIIYISCNKNFKWSYWLIAIAFIL